jgi:phenylacetate-CoA ligase
MHTAFAVAGHLAPLWRRGVTRAEIVANQDKLLRRLITHAYENVPYYRRLFDLHNIQPGRIQTAVDLGSLPISSRRDLQSGGDIERVAQGINPDNLIARPTSGSSGEPLVVRRTLYEERLLNLFRRRAMNGYGLRARDKIAHITLKGTLDIHDQQFPLALLQAAGFYRRIVIDCLRPLEEIRRSLRHFRPDAIVGYASVLARLSQSSEIKDEYAIRPRFVVSGGEVLTAQMREQIEAAFGVPVYDVYGSHEFNLIAWQCKSTGMFHTCDDALIVEVLNDGRPAHKGERGEVVATGLHSFAMPFIRYRLGDIVTKGEEVCRCGQPFSSIESIQGRMYDCFPLPGSRSIYSFQLWSIIRQATSWISLYQLVQEELGRFVLLIVTCRLPVAEEIAMLTEAIGAALGPGVDLEVRLVREIPSEPSGKFRAFRPQVVSGYVLSAEDQLSSSS